MVLFQNFYLPAHRVATIYSEIYTQLLISRSKFYMIPQQYHFQLIQPIRFPFFLKQASTTKAAIAKALTLANPLLYQAFIQAIFLRFNSISTAMATSDHIPEVCFQVPILQVSAASLHFPSSQFYFI